MNDPETIKKILSMKRIAVVGLSPKPERPSNGAASYLKSAGYAIIPVNPGHEEILGEPSYPNLHDIPGPVEVVTVFRRLEHVAAIMEDAIAIGAKAIWLQDGLINKDAARLAEEAGLLVVMDDCIERQHRSILGH